MSRDRFQISSRPQKGVLKTKSFNNQRVWEHRIRYRIAISLQPPATATATATAPPPPMAVAVAVTVCEILYP